jgi:hypothetical protein
MENVEKINVADNFILSEIFANKPKIGKTYAEITNTDRRLLGEKRVSDELVYMSEFSENKTAQINAVNNLIASMRTLNLRSYALLVCQAKSPAEFINILTALADKIKEAESLGVLETSVKAYLSPKE